MSGETEAQRGTVLPCKAVAKSRFRSGTHRSHSVSQENPQKAIPHKLLFEELIFRKQNPHQRVLKHRYKIKNMLTVLSVSELHPEELRTVHHSFSRQQTNDNVTRREMRGGGWVG